jgi:carbamoyl-phosphate synthase large subunit
MKNILISPVGGQAIVGIIDYFKKNEYTIIGIDSNPEAIGKFFCDSFQQVPPVGGNGYKSTILDIISDFHVDMFISWLDPEIIFWNDQYYHGEIPEQKKKKFAMNFREDLDILYDKFHLFSLLKNHHLDTPDTLLLSREDDDNRLITYPVVIKPRTGFGSKETHIAETSQDAEYIRRTLQRRSLNPENFIIQEFIEGREYTIDFFASDGQIENSVIRNRLEHRGVSLRGEIVNDDEIDRVVQRVCSTLRLDGLNNLQIIKRNNTCYITDINLRPSGTIVFSIYAGVDLIRNVIERMEGRPLSHYEKPRSLKMVRYLSEFYYE